jgi:hypothetical protein
VQVGVRGDDDLDAVPVLDVLDAEAFLLGEPLRSCWDNKLFMPSK